MNTAAVGYGTATETKPDRAVLGAAGGNGVFLTVPASRWILALRPLFVADAWLLI